MSLNLRRHYPILIALVVVISVLTFALGDLRVIAYTTRAESTAATKTTYDFTNEVDLLDGQNALLKHFMASDTFKALYEAKLKEVYEKVYASGVMTEQVETYSKLIHSVNDERGLVDMTAYDQAVERVLSFVTQRMEYLKSTELLSQ